METIKKIRRVSSLILGRPRFVFIALIIIIAALVYFNLGNKTPEEIAQEELAAAITAVNKLMVLPKGDEPVLATVTDAEALKAQQAFFVGAVDGDQLLLFPKNLKAVIYSPSRNKIINAGPIEQDSKSEDVSSKKLLKESKSVYEPTNEKQDNTNETESITNND